MTTRVIIESPFAGDRERNRRYLIQMIQDCRHRDESPYASHRIFAGIGDDEPLDDNDPTTRQWAINAGFEWARVADYRVFGINLGISSGMKDGFADSLKHKTPMVFRSLPAWLKTDGMLGQGQPAQRDLVRQTVKALQGIAMPESGADLEMETILKRSKFSLTEAIETGLHLHAGLRMSRVGAT